MPAEKTPNSPRLTRLQESIYAGDSGALAAFWHELSVQGTPLVEPDDAQAEFSLVTLLWRGTPGTRAVAVEFPVDGTGQDEHLLARLPASDVWYATFRLRNDYRASYKFKLRSALHPDQVLEQPDPLNPHSFVEPKDDERPDHAEDDIDSVIRLSAVPPPPWVVPRPDVAQGRLSSHRFRSRILDNERRIWVYTPPGYRTDRAAYGLLVVLDGRFFTYAVRVPAILDNLLADRQIAPLVAVMVDNPGATWSEAMDVREKEFSCYRPFAAFFSEELLPWLRQHHHLSTAPEEIVIGGGSFGALAAAYAAQQHPQTFGNAIALPGSFWWKPDEDLEWEWLTRRIAAVPVVHDNRFALQGPRAGDDLLAGPVAQRQALATPVKAAIRA